MRKRLLHIAGCLLLSATLISTVACGVPADSAQNISIESNTNTSAEGAEPAPLDEKLVSLITEYLAKSGLEISDKVNMDIAFVQAILNQPKYVRTPVTVYTNSNDAKITSFLKKGTQLQVTDFKNIDENGVIDMYKVKSEDIEGWVYGKYLVDTLEEAEAVYNENSTYDTHRWRTFKYDLFGGSPANLDYYPYERTELDSHELLTEAKAMYLNSTAALSTDKYIDIINRFGVNAVVIDIKDGALGYQSPVAKELSPTSYASAKTTAEAYSNMVKAYKDAGVYTIGRIVVFNDSHYAADNPDSCIESSLLSSKWPSAYSRDAWYYNVALAQEAVKLMGFDEIQFDYIRFPENSYGMSKPDADTDFKNVYDEEKAEAIQNFLFYAADQIHNAGAYFSVDVFGECVDGYVTAYGQYWPAMSNIADAISAMPYSDHYGREIDTWTNPYGIIAAFSKKAASRQSEIPTPGIARTWVTGYNTPFWEPTVDYNEQKMTEQIQALYDNGLYGGFIPWNVMSSIEKYNEYGGIWSKNYQNIDNEQ